MNDKYNAVWVSHSSINDYISCPRSYYLRNVYKDKLTGRKISLIKPSLALGQVIHDVLESLSYLSVEKRFTEPLINKFNLKWVRVSGKKGGFESMEEENKYKKRGEEMIGRVSQNPGPLKKLAVKIKTDLPYYWISEQDNIILCGKIDWLEYLKDTDSVHIIDFKTGKGTETDGSLQLPIYHLLVHNCQQRKVTKASYWYLDRDNMPISQPLPDLTEAYERVMTVARRVKLARQLNKFDCPRGKDGCQYCQPYEKIIHGEGEQVGINDFGQSVYIIPRKPYEEMAESEIL